MQETKHAVTYWKRLATITVVAMMMMAVIIPSFAGFSQNRSIRYGAGYAC